MELEVIRISSGTDSTNGVLFEIDKLQFIFRWFSSFIYTLFFLLIMQYFFPIRRIQNA